MYLLLQGNSGGPLMCDNDLIGIQTYINGCNQPYLYQILSSWDDMISCAIEEKCEEEQCAKMCFYINKDPITKMTTSTSSVTEEIKIKLVDAYMNETSISTISAPTLTTTAETSEIIIHETTSTTVRDTQGTTTTTVTSLSTVEDTTTETKEHTEREIADVQEESARKANVEAKQQVLRSDATINTFCSFKYFMCGYLILLGMV